MRTALIGRGLAWLLCLAALAATTVLTGSPWAFGLLAAALLLPFLSALWNRALRRQRMVLAELPSGARKGEPVRGTVRVPWSGAAPAGRTYVRLELRNDLTGERREITLPLDPAKDAYEAELEIATAHCGGLRLTMKDLIFTDAVGFLPLRCPADGEARLTVLPETFPVDADALPAAAAGGGEEVRDDRKGNDRTETFQLRDYVPGDDLHGIHWKLTGKLDRPVYREPAQQVSNDLLLYWDQEAGSPEQLDALAEAVFSVGQGLCEKGRPFTAGRSEDGALRLYEIPDREALAQTFPVLLRRNGARRIGPEELDGFGRVLYFTAEPSDAPAPENVDVFLCTEGNAGGGNAVAFTPADATKKLERLGTYGS